MLVPYQVSCSHRTTHADRSLKSDCSKHRGGSVPRNASVLRSCRIRTKMLFMSENVVGEEDHRIVERQSFPADCIKKIKCASLLSRRGEEVAVEHFAHTIDSDSIYQRLELKKAGQKRGPKVMQERGYSPRRKGVCICKIFHEKNILTERTMETRYSRGGGTSSECKSNAYKLHVRVNSYFEP